MKEKVIIFIIGLLLGAVLATGAIVVYTNTTNNNTTTNEMSPESNNGMPDMQNGDSQTPPEKPSESSTQSSKN